MSRDGRQHEAVIIAESICHLAKHAKVQLGVLSEILQYVVRTSMYV